jgi:hypothetical protein
MKIGKQKLINKVNMKNIILIVIAFNCLNLSAQEVKRIKTIYKNVFRGTYSKDTLILNELLEAPRINRFDYDQRLKSSTLLDSIGGNPKREFVYYYNEKEQLRNITYGNGVDVIWSNQINAYNPDGLLIVSLHCDSLTKHCTTKWMYGYDKRKNLISETLWEKGKIVRRHEINITYKRNRLLSKEIKEYQGDHLIIHKMEKFKKGMLVFEEDLFRKATIKYTYYKSGEEKTSTRNFKDGDGTQYTFLEFNEYGDPSVKAWVEESGYGEIITYSYEYY